MALDETALRTLGGDADAARTLRPRRRHWRRWSIIALIALVAAAVFLVRARQPVDVTTATVRALPANAPPAAVLDASGFVVARRQATVSAKVTGKVVSVYVEEGRAVKAGDVLARLDDSQATLQQSLAQRQIEAAAATTRQMQVLLADAQRALARGEQLHQRGMISQAELDTARANAASLAAQADAATGTLAVAQSTERVRRQDLADLVVRAPFDGVVVSKDAQPGEMVSPISAGGGFTRTGIATIVDMASREIEVDVNEAFIHRVRDGQRTEATLDAYPDWRIASHVINIVPAADRQKATVRVRIGFDALDPRILPDMGIKVRFLQDEAARPATPAAPVALVPTAALVKDGERDALWLVRDGRAHRVTVQLGAVREGQTEVKSGVNIGDTLIAAPPASLAEGTRVRATATAQG
jgi:RND family efflux transporter MFP subunit